MNRALAAFVAALLMVACNGCPVPPQPAPVPPTPAPAAVDARAVTCADVCDHLRDLRCDAAFPTASGHSCEEVCDNVQGSGITKLDLRCRSTAPSCTAVDACR